MGFECLERFTDQSQEFRLQIIACGTKFEGRGPRLGDLQLCLIDIIHLTETIY